MGPSIEVTKVGESSGDLIVVGESLMKFVELVSINIKDDLFFNYTLAARKANICAESFNP
jgi:hypothetical protein